MCLGIVDTLNDVSFSEHKMQVSDSLGHIRYTSFHSFLNVHLLFEIHVLRLAVLDCEKDIVDSDVSESIITSASVNQYTQR